MRLSVTAFLRVSHPEGIAHPEEGILPGVRDSSGNPFLSASAKKIGTDSPTAISRRGFLRARPKILSDFIESFFKN